MTEKSIFREVWSLRIASRSLRPLRRFELATPELFELAFFRSETQIKRLTTMYKIVNSKIAVNIPGYIVGLTRVTSSYHSSKFMIGSNGNTFKYNGSVI